MNRNGAIGELTIDFDTMLWTDCDMCVDYQLNPTWKCPRHTNTTEYGSGTGRMIVVSGYLMRFYNWLLIDMC